MVALLPAPAYAGHWVLTISGSGEADSNGRSQSTYTAPTAPTTGSISIPQIAAGAGVGPSFGGIPPTIKANASLSVTVKGAWTADANSDNTVPPSVLFSVNSSAQAYYNNSGGPVLPGQANDGYSDPVAQTGSLSQIGVSTTPTPAKFVSSQSGSVSITVTLSASATGTPGFFQGGGQAEANVGPVTIAVHAQPYNFRRIPGAGVIGTNGEIDWAYAYSSTDDNPSDLTSCTWHEHLTYPGGQVGTQAAPNKYYPPSPPFGYPASGTTWLNNPDFATDYSMVPSPPGSSPEIDDRTLVPACLKPYVYGTYNTTQVFEFNDSATGEKNVQIPGPDSGPFTIVRTVKYVDATHYEYDVSKASVPNTLSLPN